MRVKSTALFFGVLLAFYFFVTGIMDLWDDGLTPGEWLGTILFSIAAFVGATWAYYRINVFLHKRHYSLHDDEDFEE